jgi:hypothetical protein
MATMANGTDNNSAFNGDIQRSIGASSSYAMV